MNGCFSRSRSLPDGFNIPQYVASLNHKGEYTDCKNEHKEPLINVLQLKQVYQTIPKEYKSHKGVRLLIVAALAIGIVMAILASHGVFNLSPVQFSQAFTTYLNNVNWIKVGIGVGIFLVLMVGAAIIINRVMNKKDPITGIDGGKFSGDEHWVAIAERYTQDVEIEPEYENDQLIKEGGTISKGTPSARNSYVDTSTLRKGEKGTAHGYRVKNELQHNSIAMGVGFSAPLHAVMRIAYNVIRLIVIPFVILGAIIAEKVRGTPYNQDNPFKAKHILIEMGRSLWAIIKAPFYAMAILFGVLYSLIDPLNGSKLISYIERDWNDDVPLIRGFWISYLLARGTMDKWQWEGAGYMDGMNWTGFSPDRLGKTALYFPGCKQPILSVNYDEEGKIISLTGQMTKEEQSNYPRTGYTRQMAIDEASRWQDLFKNEDEDY